MSGCRKSRIFFINALVFVLIFMFITEPVLAQQTTLQRTDETGDIEYQKIKNLGREDGTNQDVKNTSNQLDYPLDPQTQLVPVIQVHVVGDVILPGVYRTKLATRAAELIQKATPKRNNIRLYQVRHQDRKSVIYDLYKYYYSGDLANNPYLSDGDVIFIPKQKGTIRIEGPVNRPGFYELVSEKNLAQIVTLAGGFSAAVSKITPIKVIRFIDGGNKYVHDVTLSDDELKKFAIQDGDIIVIPDVMNSEKKFDYSVETIPGENLIYPTSVAEVFVIGSVENPGPYKYKSHLTVKDYIGFAGANSDANLNSVMILREGKKKRQRLSAKVQAGDVLMVKEKGLNQFVSYLSIASTLLSVTLSAIVLQDVLKN